MIQLSWWTYWEDHIGSNRRSVTICQCVWTRSGILQFSSTEPHQRPMVWELQHQGRYQIRHWSHKTTQIPDWICRSGIQHQLLWDVHRRTIVYQVRCRRNIFIIHLPRSERQTTQQIEDKSSEKLHNRWLPHAQETSDDPTNPHDVPGNDVP